MARLKRSSKILDAARQRLAGLKKIPDPDFGPGLTAATYESDINGFSSDLDSYNGDVAALDAKQNSLNNRELGLRDSNTRILSAVEAKYGPDSNEYELVGGTRRSERKRPTRKPKPTS